MVKRVKKCRRIAKMAVMEMTQMAGMKTRARSLALSPAAKKRKADRSESGDVQIRYMKLRNRSLVMENRERSESGLNSERIRSRCSSSSSCEAVEENAEMVISDVRVYMPWEDDDGSSMCQIEYIRNCREVSTSSNQIICSGELESSRQSTPEFRMPTADEIDEFLTSAEKSEKKRFLSRYNFDVDNEVPLEGRYEWVRINP